MSSSRFPFALALATALELPASSSAAQHATASIVGGLVERAGHAPIPGATILLVGTGSQAITDSAGSFRYADLPPGAHRLEARAIGYVKSVWEVRLAEGEELRYEFELDVMGYELP